MNEAIFRRRRDQEEFLPTLPGKAFAALILAVFFTQACVLVDIDLMNGLRGPFWWVLTKGAAFGLTGALSLLATRNHQRFFSIAALAVGFILIFVFTRIDSGLPQTLDSGSPARQQTQWRVAMDGTISLLALSLGYVLLFRSMISHGIRHVRTRAELALAEEVQQALAPPLATVCAGYEVHGRSAPGSQMGGDLLDAVDHPTGLTAYVADVAGHGIQAGIFMGMVKSSVRTCLLRPGPLEGLLGDLNRVVFDVRTTPATYVTFASLRCGPNGQVGYSLAGSGPILHYSAASKTITRLAMEQFPLGLFSKAAFHSGAVEVATGDILALSTDGLPETTNANDEQFELDRIGAIIADKAAAPLPEIVDLVFDAVRRHGRQTDDETLLLVRARR